jgi:AraC-like DNA-binding protein
MVENDPLYQLIKIPRGRSFQITDWASSKKSLRDVNSHYHDLYEIVLYKEISGVTTLNGVEDKLVNDSILYLPPYCVHSFSRLSCTSGYTVLHLSFNYMERLPVVPMLFELTPSQRVAIENLMLWGKDEVYTEELREQAIKLIMLWINNLGSNDTVTFRGGATLFKPLLQFLDKERCYNINSSDAAKLCNMSRSSFMIRFKKHFGTTFHRFLTEKRVLEAKYLLRNSSMNCTEVAAFLNFSDSAHFSRVFYQAVGVLPKEFSRNNL